MFIWFLLSGERLYRCVVFEECHTLPQGSKEYRPFISQTADALLRALEVWLIKRPVLLGALEQRVTLLKYHAVDTGVRLFNIKIGGSY